ncbi:MAG: hypothetical protein FWH57_00325 [Oscillospiraceae bacterium]|nr:hypothetical protein [Oscillospiraceae bacterium]
MGNDTYIKYIDYYLPGNYITVEDVFSSLDDEVFKSKNIETEKFISKFKTETRLDKISVFQKEDDLAIIIANMVDKLLDETKIDPHEIGYIVCGNDVLMRYNNTSIIHYIQNVYNFDKSTVIPLIQPCTASLFAMGLSRNLLDQEKKYMLIINACKLESPEDRFIDFTMRGDGIGLLLVGCDAGSLRITGWNSCNLGNPSYNKIVKKPQSQDYRGDMISRGISFIEETLAKFKLERKNIGKVITSNVRYDVYHDVYSHYLKMSPKIFFLENIPNGGHIVDVDIIRNLKDYIESNEKPTKNQNIILYSPDLQESLDVNYHLVSLDRVE